MEESRLADRLMHSSEKLSPTASIFRTVFKSFHVCVIQKRSTTIIYAFNFSLKYMGLCATLPSATELGFEFGPVMNAALGLEELKQSGGLFTGVSPGGPTVSTVPAAVCTCTR